MPVESDEIDDLAGELVGFDPEQKTEKAVAADPELGEAKSDPAAVSETAPVIVSVEDLSISYFLRSPMRNMLKRFSVGGAGGVNGKVENQNKVVVSSNSSTVEVKSLQDVSFTLRQGEHVGLIGTNGAGKTTLLRAISGVLPAQKGSVKAPDNMFALLSISAGFDAELSAYENLKLRALYAGLPAKSVDQYVEDIIEFSELGKFFFLPLKTYSAGMKARFALGVATFGKPDLLVMDEWVGAGDARFRAKANERLKTFVSNSGALLLASHSYAILQAWVPRVIWMDEGRIIADGPRDDVFKEYTQFLAAKR